MKIILLEWLRNLKFFLNISKEEQRKRFMARIDTPSKNWKLSSSDIRERQYWNKYQAVYEKQLMQLQLRRILGM